jgi:diketogulonate reductase-like aldo/keto reductase
MDLHSDTTIPLSDGNAIPQIGFGLFQLTDPEETRTAVQAALEAGYRHFDDAAVYSNEKTVGEALKQSGIPRGELYLTTKCWISDFGTDRTRDACRRSLELLGVEYVDLYLIHWPIEPEMMEAWEVFQQLRAEGLCRSIGVSNVTKARFQKGFLPHTDVLPVLNQIECHPQRSQREVQTFCEENGIVVQAYSPLGRGEVLQHPELERIAREVGKTPAQVVLRWHLQHNRIIIPKSANRERIRENIDLFDLELSPEHMASIDALDRDESVISWRPRDGEGWY